MKTRSTILKAALSLGLLATANADTIYVNGSTAFRTAFNDAVFSLMNAEGGCTASFSGSDFRSAAAAVITGNIGGVPTTIKTVWTGSVTGVQSLASPSSVTLRFITGNTPTTVSRTGTYPNFTYTGGQTGIAGATTGGVFVPTSNEIHVSDLAMSDVFQGSTAFTSPVLAYDQTVAVVPFIFVASDNSDTAGTAGTGFDNITPLQARLLWGSGRVSLSLLTGDAADNKTPSPADTAKEVFAFGRNNDSGTRLTLLAEMGKGALSGVTQFSFNPSTNAFTNTGNAGTNAANQALWLADDDFSNTVGYAIGMLGVSDATTARDGDGLTNNGGATWLKWSGVPYSEANVRSGKYSAWGYQHLFARPLTGGVPADDAVQAVADALADEMRENPGLAGIKLDSMNVQRGSEGGLIDLND